MNKILRLFGVIFILGGIGGALLHFLYVRSAGTVVAIASPIRIIPAENTVQDGFLFKDFQSWQVDFNPVTLGPEVGVLKLVLTGERLGAKQYGSRASNMKRKLFHLEYALTNVKNGQVIYSGAGDDSNKGEGSIQGKSYFSLGQAVIHDSSDYRFSMKFSILKRVLALTDRPPDLRVDFVAGGVEVDNRILMGCFVVILLGIFISLITRSQVRT